MTAIPTPTQGSDHMFQEAATWHIRLRNPDVSADQHDAFLVWVRQDPRHLETYDRVEALWQSMGHDDADTALRDEAAIVALIAEGRPRHRLARSVAVVGLAVIAGLAIWQGPDAFDSLRADHIAWTGQREHLTLPDGTRIDLNSGTAIAVDFSDSARRIRMFRGEAFFDVETDSARPFVVDMPSGRLSVTGTRFNVDLTQKSADIALVEGSVTLAARDMLDSTARLSAGQQATLHPARIEPPQSFDAESRVAWRSGRMIFYRTALSDVLAELGRYQRGRIVLMNDDAALMPVTGAFSTDDPAEATDIIAETLGLTVHRLPGALTVIR